MARILGGSDFDRVLGSVHSLAAGDGFEEPGELFAHRAPAEVVRSYLAEVAVLVSSDQPFQVLAHIDYPVRSWPAGAGEFDPADFEEEFRHVLRLAADSGRAFEVNTRVPLHATMVTWWHEEGGAAITFGSDAHEPDSIARGFADAEHLAEERGFRPSKHPHELWGRWTSGRVGPPTAGGRCRAARRRGTGPADPTRHRGHVGYPGRWS